MASRIGLQQLWLRVHRWIGLGLLPVFAALALTGAVLVFPTFFDRLANPERYPDRASDTVAAASTLLREGAVRLPQGDRPSAIRYPEAGGAVMVAGQVSGPPNLGLGPPKRAKVWLDPADGAVLSTSDGRADFLWSMHATHGHLLLKGVGRDLLAWIGVVLLVSAASGLWLWWPGLRHVGRALRWQHRASISLNLHRQSGAVIALILILETITGIYVAAPAVFTSVIEPGAPARQMSEGPAATLSLASPRLDIDAALQAAVAVVPEGRIASIFLPTEKLAAWVVNFESEDGSRAVHVAEADGRATLRPAPPPGPARRVESVMTDLHFGHYGVIWRWVVFLSGVAMSLLAITGPLIWLQGRKRRAKRASAGAMARAA
ncbi:MAG: PepSY domain-containing protein [Steroidobacteraceae bacterium]|nr:PepSY domain-containing protein [Steroidobacteraceae bacterium]